MGRIALILLSVILIANCNRKAGKDECARYTRHLSELAANPGIDAALKATDGKAAVVSHCMELKKSQVECANEAASLSDATACEHKKGSILDF